MTVPTPAQLMGLAPQFRVLDLDAACAFYVEKLGFRVAFTHGGFYAAVERDGVTLHLKHADTPDPGRDARLRDEHLDVYVTVDDVAALYAEYQGRGVTFARPLETRPWGMREFVVYDSDGYILYFGQPASPKK